MKKHIILILSFFLASGLAYGQSKRGLVLVIGNSAYAEGALKNPINDANDISAKFRSLGFDVIDRINASQEQMAKAINDFGLRASNYDVAVFYYSGHGIQYNGDNYLIPVNASLNSEADIRFYCENVNRVLAKLEESQCKLKILMLDACRNNPFERSWSRAGSSKGLSSMDAPMGTIISYATAPGSTAEDGVGQRNSPYTAAFLNLLDKQNYSIVMLYNELCNVVRKSTNNRQNPWSSNSGIDGEFCFNIGSVAQPAKTPVSTESAEALYQKGNEYYKKSDFAEAVKYYRQAAEKGNANAQLQLGYCYDKGKGVQQNYEEAFKWFKKSAEQGYDVAENRLGTYYYKGKGVAKDYRLAVYWFRMSAEHGNRDSMYNLGLCYQYGNGVSKDLSQARRWYQKAADQGDTDAKKKLEELGVQEVQGFAVKSFASDGFVSAVPVVKDQNGQTCAQIKIKTPYDGYQFDLGILGIVKMEKREAEILLYVPYGVRKITITHPKFGVIRDYMFPCKIEQGKSYVMSLNHPN